MDNASNNTEIDLAEVSNTVKSGFKKFLLYLYYFFKKNLFILIGLFVIGAVLGYFLDKKMTSYTSEIHLKTDLNNIDYLYTKISALNSKLKNEDYLAANNINLNGVSKIEVSAIEDPYSFVAKENEKTFDLLKLFAEENDINKVVSDDNFLKNYKNHVITIYSGQPINQKEVFESLMNHLNSNDYYKKLNALTIQTSKEKISANNEMIKQINMVLENINNTKTSNSNSLLLVGESSNLSELLKMKDQLISENHAIEFTFLNNANIFKIVNADIFNVIQKERFFLFVLPLLFLGLYIFISFFRMIIGKLRQSDEK